MFFSSQTDQSKCVTVTTSFKTERKKKERKKAGEKVNRVTESCLSLGLGRVFFFFRQAVLWTPSSHSTHSLKVFASGWHNECVCVCRACAPQGPRSAEPERQCGGVCVRAGVCSFDVMFVLSVVAMALSLTPDAQDNWVSTSFWPTGSGHKRRRVCARAHTAAQTGSVKHKRRLIIKAEAFEVFCCDHWRGTAPR